MSQFPNAIQTCVLFEDDAKNFDAVLALFLVAAGERGWHFNHIEKKPNSFHRIFGGPDLMITMEKMAGPASRNVFAQALASPFTKMTAPTAEVDIANTKCHVIINVNHGALPASREISKLLDSIGYVGKDHSLEAFKQRLEVCAELTNFSLIAGRASLVHWTQSNQMVETETFKEACKQEIPSLLHIHPRLVSGKPDARGELQISLLTFGATHFLGREIAVTESPVPWVDSLTNILVFINLATMPNGYVIPDGDIFRPENEDFAYRVRHKAAEDGMMAHYELQPCYHKKSGFIAPDYILKGREVNYRRPPEEIFGEASQEGHRLVKEWREKAKMAEGAGGGFSVKAKSEKEKPKHWFSRFLGR